MDAVSHIAHGQRDGQRPRHAVPEKLVQPGVSEPDDASGKKSGVFTGLSKSLGAAARAKQGRKRGGAQFCGLQGEPGDALTRRLASMPAVPFASNDRRRHRVPALAAHVTRRCDGTGGGGGGGWCALIVGLARGARRWRLPTFLWTRDSGSYLTPAVWVGSIPGEWITSARRGPLYSLFLAGHFPGRGKAGHGGDRPGGDLGACDGGPDVAHGAWAWLGRRGFWPLAFSADFSTRSTACRWKSSG